MPYPVGYPSTSECPCLAEYSEIAGRARDGAHGSRLLGQGGPSIPVRCRLCICQIANQLMRLGKPTSRLATGLDSRSAAPIRGIRRGSGDETMSVEVAVLQESAQSQQQ